MKGWIWVWVSVWAGVSCQHKSVFVTGKVTGKGTTKVAAKGPILLPKDVPSSWGVVSQKGGRSSRAAGNSRTAGSSRLAGSPRLAGSQEQKWLDRQVRLSCSEPLARIAPHLRELWPFVSKGKGQASPYFHIAQLSSMPCKGSEGVRLRALMQVQDQESSGRVGVLLPLSGKRQALGQAVLEGIKAAVKARGGEFSRYFLVRDTQSTWEGVQQGLADMMFYENPTLLMGGLTTEERPWLADKSTALQVPVFLLNKQAPLGPEYPYVFRIYPDDDQLARSLAGVLEYRGLKKVGILRPSSGKADGFLDALKQQLKERNMVLADEFAYEADRFESLDQAVMKIAGADPKERPEAYKTFIREAKVRGLEPASWVLPPEPKSDVIVVPDHFRTVHHVVRLLKYHGLQHMALAGHPEWRSMGLLQPWEPFLEKALFVDYMGGYDELPLGITYALLPGQGPYLVAPDKTVWVDFQMMGYRAASIALQTLSSSAAIGPRSRLPKRLLAQKTEDRFFGAHLFGPHLFAPHLAFHPNRQVYWPAHVFQVSEGGIKKLSPIPGTSMPGPLAGAAGNVSATPR